MTARSAKKLCAFLLGAARSGDLVSGYIALADTPLTDRERRTWTTRLNECASHVARLEIHLDWLSYLGDADMLPAAATDRLANDGLRAGQSIRELSDARTRLSVDHPVFAVLAKAWADIDRAAGIGSELRDDLFPIDCSPALV